MIEALRVIDGFYPDPTELRHRVVSSNFGDQVGPDGETYTGISLFQEPSLIHCVESAIQRQIEVRMAFFRLNFDKELPKCWVHSDNICAQWAGLLYLNPSEQCSGGTAFWRHRNFDLDVMPTAEEAHAIGREPGELAKQIGQDWKELNLWQMTGFVGMKFNRFVTYPTRMFHSRFPFEGFGTDQNNGRLIWVVFYDVLT